MAVLDWLQQLLGGGGDDQSGPAVQQNSQGVFQPYTPPPAPSALDMLGQLTGANDMQQAYGAAQRGEYLPALGQGAWGAGQAAALAVPALRGGLSAVRAGAPVAREMAGAIPALMRDEFGGIKLYHGSPYDFSPEPGAPLGRFRDDKIGTGEGAQAYAYGHYGAEAEPVAQGYKQDLGWQNAINSLDRFLTANQGVNLQPDEIAARLRGTPAEALAQDPRAIASLQQLLPNYLPSIPVSGRDLGHYRYLDDVAQRLLPGKMYELNVNAEPDQFLQWDKPAIEQPANVQDALGRIWQQLGGTTEGRQYPPFAAHSETTGEGLHAALATTLGSKEAAAAALRDAGVPGVRYLDAGSRGAAPTKMKVGDVTDYPSNLADQHWSEVSAQKLPADPSFTLGEIPEAYQGFLKAHTDLVDHSGMMTPKDALNPQNNFDAGYSAARDLLKAKDATAVAQGTSNYVVFDPSIIEILRKYGLAGLTTGAGLLGAADQQ